MNDTPAFPTTLFEHGGESNGMTLRDYFAAKAMQGAVSGFATKGEVFRYSVVAGFSYEMADAMMEAREA